MSVKSLNSTHRSINNELAKGESPHTTILPKKTGDIEAFRKKMDSVKDMVLKTMILTSKHQAINMDGGGGGGNNMASQMLETTSTMASFEMQDMQMEQTLKNIEMQKEANFATLGQMPGKRVSLDDSNRHFNGKDLVKFQYNIIGKDLPASAQIQTQISLMDSEGKKILTKSDKGQHIGKNSFLWDGKDDTGKIVDMGDYTISVTASYTLPNKNGTPSTSLLATTTKEGVVDEVIRDGDSIHFIIDGQKYSKDSIRGISRSGIQDIDEDKEHIQDYINYVGKTVQVKQEKINFNNNKVNVPFITQSDGKNTKVEVRFFDSNGDFVAYAEQMQDVKIGQNNFSWDGMDVKSAAALKDMKENRTFSYVPVGTYKYEVSTTVIKDGAEVKSKLENNGNFVIDALDQSSGKIMLASGSYKFAIKDVKKIVDKVPEKVMSSKESLFREGTEFLRKTIVYKGDVIEYDGNGDKNITFMIPNPGTGSSINEATIDVKDHAGKLVASFVKPAAELYAEDKEPVPTLDAFTDIAKNFSTDSQQKILDFLARTFSDYDQNTQGAFTILQKDALKQYVTHGFRDGTIFQIAYDALPDQATKAAQELKNRGIIKATWDGKGLAPDNRQIAEGKYTISISYQIKDATNAVHNEDLALTPQAVVVGTHLHDGKVMLDLANGDVISYEDILEIRA